ncbi:hypothetical protein FN846DRAFT_998176 [Sphaerosporella brunnea]|uniref:C3H1-type domain-containing protein n=1 Tax=Sphaerosporella brunnea TaxID=1250544 RepID=A0A5J5EJ59_9PEZI|nr:hypothetical protein FN846DRAFT_998176 [Sphaerosporella brunnea]
MVRTRATPTNQTTTARDEDEVDYGDDADLTEISELERQLAGTAGEPTSGQLAQANTHVAATPEPAPTSAQASVQATLTGDNAGTVVTVPMAFLNKMSDTMSALTTTLSTLHGPQAHRAQAQIQPVQGTTLPFPPPENPQVQSIRTRWPAVDPAHLQEILEDRFKVENLLKLNASFVYTPDRRLENITLGSFQIPTTSRNVEIEEYQSITQLLKPLAVYADILREFAPPEIRDPLSSTLLQYMHYLMDLNERCTWHSVRLYHFSFHRRRVLQGVYDYEGWRKFSDPELNHLLQARGAPQGGKRPADGQTFSPPAKRIARTTVPSSSLPPQRVSGACRRHNRGLCAAGSKCMYQHVCWACGEGTHTASACPQAQQ